MPNQPNNYNLSLPPTKDETNPLQRPQRDNTTLDELYDAIQQLTQAIRELRDHISMEAWNRDYGPVQSDARRARPVSPTGQPVADPAKGTYE